MASICFLGDVGSQSASGIPYVNWTYVNLHRIINIPIQSIREGMVAYITVCANSSPVGSHPGSLSDPMPPPQG